MTWYESAFGMLILLLFFLFVYAKMTNKGFGEIFKEIKEGLERLKKDE